MTPALAGRPDRRARVRTDDQVVADERAVDVEGDEPIGRMGSGVVMMGTPEMMPDGRPRRWRGEG